MIRINSTRNNPVHDLGYADTFPVFSETKDVSTENPVDAAIRMAREAFLLAEADRLELENATLREELHDLARATLEKGTDTDLVSTARIILAEAA